MINHALRTSSSLWLSACVALAIQPAWAATTDIAPAPLETSVQTVVKPNLMLILDDSGSMGLNFMPDGVEDFPDRDCALYSGFNRIWFDPNVTYRAPVDAKGDSYPDSDFKNAKRDGFLDSSGIDLSDPQNICVNIEDGAVCGAYYATYSGSAPRSCDSDLKYKRFTDSSKWTDAQKVNYANWYTYYRTRLQMMKSAVGLVFKAVSSNYRVGFTTISNKGGKDTGTFLSVSDFDSAQRGKFYEKLYGAKPSGSTPLRGALSKAGRYFANKLEDQVDPVQYSCQKNFAILSTDGYWNKFDETSSYGPKDLGGSSNVGDADTKDVTVPTPATPFNGRIKDKNKWVKGSGDTLSDVAYYYYMTDLRNSSLGNCAGAISGVDVCKDNVPAAGSDTASHQHMTTFSLGLGVNGTLNYLTNYDSASGGDYYDIVQGTKWWPDPFASSEGERIDDLWHAAVNGRGRYYSANDANAVVAGLTDALAKIDSVKGSSAAAATSTLQPVAGNNFVYVAQYVTQKWVGDLIAYKIDETSGVVDTKNPLWSAAAKLKSKSSASRNIYYAKQSGSRLVRDDFTFNMLGQGSGNLLSLFSGACSKVPALSQCATTLAGNSTAIATANSGEAMVNWLRGDGTYEAGALPVFRVREERLGDIVNASPVFVGAPPFIYVDNGYADFKNRNASRAARIYAAANDGMLHAFDKDGNEAWAYVPRSVMPNLYRLADANYANNHIWTVDGSPVVGDVYDKASSNSNNWKWRTILVGGLNGGGRSYYALDITDPDNPEVLWEYSDDDLGLTFGNPVITKRADGKWVVIFASGYNNVNPGNGNAYLYVLDAVSGERLLKIPTYTSGTLAAGSTSTPNGLARINNWVDNDKDNTTKRVYGGDLLGNLWRFDLDNLVAPNQSALLLAQVRTGGVGQPITTKPELTEVRSGTTTRPAVLFATGRFLGTGDLADTQTQSIYAIRDPLTSRGWGEVRTQSGLKSRTLIDTTDTKTGAKIRTIDGAAIDFVSDIGWYLDLPTSRERVNVDPQQQLNVLTVASNIPLNDACTVGGESWLYSLDINTGLAPYAMNTTVGTFLAGALTAGLRVVQLATGRTQVIVTDSGGGVTNKDGGGSTSSDPSAVRRTSWRELID